MISSRKNDRVLIQDLKVISSVGCGEESPPEMQPLQLNVAVEFDGRVAAKTHLLTDTIDYTKVAHLVHELARGREWPVIELLGQCLCNGILERFPPAQSVSIEMQKFVISEARWSAVEINRSREVS